MSAGCLFAQASLAFIGAKPTIDEVVFVGRLGLAQREIWRISTRSDPVCIAKLPIQPDRQAWRGLRFAANPVREEILVVRSITDSDPDRMHKSKYCSVIYERLTFSGRHLASYKFDFENMMGFGFGFSKDGHPFAAYRDADSQKIVRLSWDGSTVGDSDTSIGDFLEGNVMSPRFAEMGVPFLGSNNMAKLEQPQNDDVVQLTSSELRVNGKVKLQRPQGVAGWCYGCMEGHGAILIALEGTFKDCKDFTRSMSIYDYGYRVNYYVKLFDGAYAVVARKGDGTEPLRIFP